MEKLQNMVNKCASVATPTDMLHQVIQESLLLLLLEPNPWILFLTWDGSTSWFDFPEEFSLMHIHTNQRW